MPPADEVVLVYVTLPDAAGAQAMGRRLVEERLAACVNILPGMRSIYRWQGEVEEASEVVLLAKTVRAQVMALSDRVRALHPAILPCILEVPVAGGYPPYLAWLAEGSRPAS